MKTLAGSSEQIRLFLGARLALATVFDRDRGQSLPCRIAEVQPFASSGIMQICATNVKATHRVNVLTTPTPCRFLARGAINLEAHVELI